MSDAVNPKDLLGIKKAPLRLVPPALAIGVAPVMALGAAKYGPYNWREYSVKLSVYLEAMQRHLAAVLDGQWLDPESGEPHVAHIAACVGIILDALGIDNIEMDWPIRPGPAADLMLLQDKSKAPTAERVEVTAYGDDEPQYICNCPTQADFDAAGPDCE